MRRNKYQGFFWKLILTILLAVLTVWLFNSSQLTTAPVEHLSGTATGDTVEYIPAGEGDVVRHMHYMLSFNDRHKQANWVYYCLRPKRGMMEAKRKDNFREDQYVRTGSAKPSDYTHSGYDRGHLCPAGDMTQSAESMSETFYMSNMSPQLPAFNRGIWKSLEEQVRKWAEEGQLYVVTGPVFRDTKGTIGQSRVTVPGFYYKVIYAPLRQRMVGFVLPNEKGRKNLFNYAVSVDSVENLTGIDFFPQLPDSLENTLETAVFKLVH